MRRLKCTCIFVIAAYEVYVEKELVYFTFILVFFFAFVWKICVCMFVDDNTKENGVEKFYIIKRVKENRARRVVVFIVQLEV